MVLGVMHMVVYNIGMVSRGGSRNKGKGGHTVAVERSMLSV